MHPPVFVAATPNDVSQLLPEMLRKGRFDELICVDLPNQNEREAIWGIQIRKYHSAAFVSWPQFLNSIRRSYCHWASLSRHRLAMVSMRALLVL